MAFSAIVELFTKGSRPGNLTNGVKTYVRSFRVTTTDKNDSSAVATGAAAVVAGLPAYGSVHPDDSECWLKSYAVDAYETNTAKEWLVVCTYNNDTSDSGSFTQSPPAANPDNDPIVIDGFYITVPEVMEKDADGTAVLNTAGDPFDPPIMREVGIQVERVTASSQTRPTWYKTLWNKANAASITFDGETYDAGYVLATNFTKGTELYRNNLTYRRYGYELHIRNDRKWTEKPILSAGFRQKVGGVVQDCIVNGVKVTAPVPLDSAGAQIAVPTTANAHYQTFKEFATADLTGLPGVT